MASNALFSGKPSGKMVAFKGVASMLGKPKIFGLGFIGAGLVTVGFLYLPDYFAGRRVDRLYAELTEQAKDIVKDILSDPYSAKFEDVRVVGDAPHLMVCGFVNAKNKLGGYV